MVIPPTEWLPFGLFPGFVLDFCSSPAQHLWNSDFFQLRQHLGKSKPYITIVDSSWFLSLLLKSLLCRVKNKLNNSTLKVCITSRYHPNSSSGSSKQSQLKQVDLKLNWVLLIVNLLSISNCAWQKQVSKDLFFCKTRAWFWKKKLQQLSWKADFSLKNPLFALP